MKSTNDLIRLAPLALVAFALWSAPPASALTVRVDLLPREALVFVDRVTGPGGLPVGVSGRVAALLSGGIDSPVAAWLLAKRGCELSFVHFHSAPYTSSASQRKVRDALRQLARQRGTHEKQLAFGAGALEGSAERTGCRHEGARTGEPETGGADLVRDDDRGAHVTRLGSGSGSR